MKQSVFRKINMALFLGGCSIAIGDQLSAQDVLLRDIKNEELVTQEESTVLEHVLEHMLIRMSERNEEPSENFLRLYEAVAKKTEIKIEDLSELLPSMIESMKEEQLRATRPDSPGIGNGAISGCCGCCDISQILAMLASIQARLVIINNLIIECCDEIQFDFQATWSILANLNVTATVDLSPVFSVITNCCNGTFSAIANLTLTATTDLSGVFSALNACCNSTFSMLDRIDREVVGTFSLLNRIIIDDQGTFSAIAACCNATFSVLANLTLTATVDLSGIFTALTACCNSTFSMLDRIDREVVGTFSLLNRIIIDDQGTFSAIAACCNATFSAIANLTVTSTTDLSGVFSSLAACCNGTFSVLANLTLTATTDLSGIFSALTACCNGTFSTLFDIKNTLTVCGAIPIFTATIITVSGNYCLANDIIGTITISASEVSLNMNNKTVFGGGATIPLIIGPGNNNVIVGNGTLQNSTLRGALITTCTHITLTNVNFVSTNSGVLISLCGDVELNECFFSDNQARIVDIANSNRVTLKNSISVNNSAASSGISMIDVNGSSNCIVIDNNKICGNNSYDSIIALLSGLSSGIKVTNCTIENNVFIAGPTAGGAYIIRIGATGGFAGPSGYVVERCVIQSNSLPDIAGTLLCIDTGFATGVGWNISNNIIQNNTSPTSVIGINIGNPPAGAVEYNNVSNNTGVASTGIVYTGAVGATTRVIGNRVQGHSNNFSIGANVALVTISFSTGTGALVSAGIVTPFHNLSMVA